MFPFVAHGTCFVAHSLAEEKFEAVEFSAQPYQPPESDVLPFPEGTHSPSGILLTFDSVWVFLRRKKSHSLLSNLPSSLKSVSPDVWWLLGQGLNQWLSSSWEAVANAKHTGAIKAPGQPRRGRPRVHPPSLSFKGAGSLFGDCPFWRLQWLLERVSHLSLYRLLNYILTNTFTSMFVSW